MKRSEQAIRWVAAAAGLAVAMPLPLASAANGISLRSVYRTGDPVPGRPGLTFTANGGSAAIGDDGTVLGVALVDGDGIGFLNNTLVHESGGVLTVIGRESDPVPGLPGWEFRASSINTAGFYDLVVAGDGGIGYVPDLFDSNTGAFGLQGVLVGPGPASVPVLYETGPAPGFSGGTFTGYLPRYVMRENQSTMLMGVVSDPGGTPSVATALWFGTPGNMTAALQTGLQAPGLPIGVNIGSMKSDSLCTDGSGNVLFHATLPLGNGINQSNRVILYHGPPDNVGVLFRTSEGVPGTPGAVLTNIVSDSTRMNRLGALCFQAFVSGGGTDEVIVSGGSGSYFTLARDGMPLPGDPSVTLDRVARTNIDMNDQGLVAFDCMIAGAPFASDTAILIGGPGGLEVVLREGDPLPGGGVAPHLVGTRWTINDRGQIAMFLGIDGESVLYATRPNGELVKLASTGEVLTPDDGPSGLVAAISFEFNTRSSDSGKPAIFNASGELVTPIRYVGSGGSGLHVWDIDDPCPADLALPFGLLDLDDINAFVAGFTGQTATGDLDGNGVWDLADVNIFVGSFAAGCP